MVIVTCFLTCFTNIMIRQFDDTNNFVDNVKSLPDVVEEIGKGIKAAPGIAWYMEAYHTTSTGSGKNRRTKRVVTR